MDDLDIIDGGCILVSRKIFDDPIFKSDSLFKLFVWCIGKASHKKQSFVTKTGRGETVVECNRGEFITGRKKGAFLLDWNQNTFWKRLNRLERGGYINIIRNRHYTIVTVVKYNRYQNIENYRRQPKGQPKGQPSEQPIIQPSNNQVTTKYPPSNTYNKDNNYNNYNNAILGDQKFENSDDSNQDKNPEILQVLKVWAEKKGRPIEAISGRDRDTWISALNVHGLQWCLNAIDKFNRVHAGSVIFDAENENSVDQSDEQWMREQDQGDGLC